MLEDELYFRPPSEADSFIIRVMHGCSYNKCYFCNMFKDIPLSYLNEDEIFAGIKQDAEDISPKFLHHVTSLYLEGGDPISIPTSKLLNIINYAKEHFPYLERVVCYATARSILAKGPKDLKKLAQAGLARVFLGLESGSDKVLTRINKGCSKADLICAGHYLNHAQIENDVSIMMGIGSYENSHDHAMETANLINITKPVCIRIRTYTPMLGTPMGDDYESGDFELMKPHAVLTEMKNLISKISCQTHLLSDHWMNFIKFDLHLPIQKDEIISALDQALLWPEDQFRPLGITDRRS